MTTAKLMIKPMLRMACAVLFSISAVVAGADDAAKEPTIAQNNIKDISYSALQGGKVEVKVTLKQPLLTLPAGFTTNNPPRIALDFPGTANALGKNLIDVGEGALRTMNIVQAGNRTRLVLNLAKPVGYETRTDGNFLIVSLQGSATAVSSTTNETTRFAEAGVTKQKHKLHEIDFRRGSNGEGRVVVGLSDSTTGIDIRKQGRSLIVDFIDSEIHPSQERKLDVADFGTPVRILSTSSQGKNVRMVIEPQGQWEYSAYQADKQFIVDVKKIIEDPNKMVPGSKQGYGGEKLSLNFQNVEVRTVLQVIADFTNLNIVTSDSVSGSLTLRLKDVPWDQALDIILNAKGLDKRKNGNVVWIAPRDELAVKEKAELEAKQQVSELEPLQTEYYALNYLRADTASRMLMGLAGISAADKSQDVSCDTKKISEYKLSQTKPPSATNANEKQQILSKRGSATFEIKTNILIINDIPSKHEEIRRLLAVIDVPAKQVMIEARVVLAIDTFGKELGVRLGTQLGGGVSDNIRYGVSQNLENSGASAYGFPQIASNSSYTLDATGLTRKDAYSESRALGGVGNSNVNLGVDVAKAAGALALTLLNSKTGNLVSLELSAMEADGKGTIISNPRVMTSNQRPASILQGVQIPYRTLDQYGRVITEFESAVLCLLVNPQILNNDSILLDVEVNKDRPGVIYADGVQIDVNRLKTQILINSGDTAVLGGIFQQETQNDVTKVPLFGDLPVIGNLFKNTARREEKRELMIFITPKILKESLNIQ